jgi:hypothetical protein
MHTRRKYQTKIRETQTKGVGVKFPKKKRHERALSIDYAVLRCNCSFFVPFTLFWFSVEILIA